MVTESQDVKWIIIDFYFHFPIYSRINNYVFYSIHFLAHFVRFRPRDSSGAFLTSDNNTEKFLFIPGAECPFDQGSMYEGVLHDKLKKLVTQKVT